MLQGLLIWLITLLLAYFVIGVLRQSFPYIKNRYLLILFLYHTLLAATYYLYALSNPSDSKGYYRKVLENYRGDNWFSFFGTGTTFIEFVGYPFVKHLGFTYESTMVVFSFFGFLGFVFFYIFCRERIQMKHNFLSVDLFTLIFFLPNLHFWSCSFGKGSLIFLGFGLFFFSLKNPGPRLWALIFGAWIIFQIRPHIFYVILIALVLGYTFSTKGVAIAYRFIILITSVILLYYINEDILRITGLEDESIFDEFISHRASDLAKATSGIDITNYSIPEKLFAFWFRPLFLDAPGILGIIVSFENLFYLIFFFNLLRPSAIRYIWNSDPVIKTGFFTFLGVSFALAQISGNLGLAMRQKSQVMILMLFVILKFMDEQKIMRWKKMLRRRARTALFRKEEKVG